MLVNLQIENYALIDRVALELGPGFNVLTGETGSGKSIIVDALGLLLGERAEAAAVRAGTALAKVGGTFTQPFAHAKEAAAWAEAHGLSEPEGEEVLLRREVGGGRSRAFVDHQPATLGLLRELARRLGEIHSQHEVLAAFTPAAQLALLDRFAGAEAETAATAAAHAAWRAARERLEADEAEQRRRLQQADLWRFQAQEIDAARPRAGEDAALEQERQRLANAEKIAALAHGAYDRLYEAEEAAAAQLKAALRQVQEWERFDAGVAALAPRLEAVRAEVADLAQEIRGRAEGLEASPGRLAEVEDRLALLDRLRRKYGPTLEDVLRQREEVQRELEGVENSEAETAAAQMAAQRAESEYRKRAGELSRRRRAAAAELARRLEAEVSDLAMTLRFAVEFEPQEPGEAGREAWSASGWERVRFLASTNPGEPLQPVAAIASGGELSRLLLGLHLVVEAGAGPMRTGAAAARGRTLVLDEIDAGIGGRAGEAVGRKLQRLARHYQVLCVTHLASIASFADHHIQVEKETAGGRTRTQAMTLAGEARVAELARMLAGEESGAEALRHARALLARNQGGGAVKPRAATQPSSR